MVNQLFAVFIVCFARLLGFNLIAPPPLQILGRHAGRLHPLEDEFARNHDDRAGVDLVDHCVAGAAIRLEGPRVHGTHWTAEMHGFAGCGLSGEVEKTIFAQSPLKLY